MKITIAAKWNTWPTFGVQAFKLDDGSMAYNGLLLPLSSALGVAATVFRDFAVALLLWLFARIRSIYDSGTGDYCVCIACMLAPAATAYAMHMCHRCEAWLPDAAVHLFPAVATRFVRPEPNPTAEISEVARCTK